MKYEVTKEKPYDPEFVAKIQESRQQAKEGKVTRVKKEELGKFLGLEWVIISILQLRPKKTLIF